MKLKLDEAGHVVVAEGKPVYVYDDGKEAAFDAPQAIQTISARNAEAKEHRVAKEGALERLKAYEGLDDPEAARRALETLKNIDQGQLIQAGKVEEIKAAAQRAAEEQIAAAQRTTGEKLKTLTRERDGVLAELHAEKIGGAFGRSKFIGEKVSSPPDMIQAMFGPRFKLDEGKVVGHDAAGNKIYSRANPGELANFDEALESMIDAYPYRDQILKGTGSSGSGAQPGKGGGAAGEKSMHRTEFNRLPPLEQRAKIQAGFKLVD